MKTVFESREHQGILAEDKESTVKPQSQQFGTGSLLCFIYNH